MNTWSPLHEYEDQLPHGPALHVVEIDKQKNQPDPGGYVALKQTAEVIYPAFLAGRARSVIYSFSLQRNSIFPSDLEHDHREEEAPEHGAQLGGAHHPRPGEDEVVPGDHHQGHLHDLNHQL